jgi:hypothetical protein
MMRRTSSGALRVPRIVAIAPQRPIPWRLLLLGGALVGGLVWWAPWRPTPVHPIRYSATGVRTNPPVCMSVMIDESSSMQSSDPEFARVGALLGAGQLFGDEGVTGDSLAAGWFADLAISSDLLAVGGETAPLPQGATSPVGEGTNFNAAVQAASEVLRDCTAGTTPALVLISDGLTDSFQGIAAEFNSLPVGTRTYMLAIDATQGFQQVANGWRDAAPAMQVVPSTSLNRKGVGTAMAKILSDLTGQRVQVVGTR